MFAEARRPGSARSPPGRPPRCRTPAGREVCRLRPMTNKIGAATPMVANVGVRAINADAPAIIRIVRLHRPACRGGRHMSRQRPAQRADKEPDREDGEHAQQLRDPVGQGRRTPQSTARRSHRPTSRTTPRDCRRCLRPPRRRHTAESLGNRLRADGEPPGGSADATPCTPAAAGDGGAPPVTATPVRGRRVTSDSMRWSCRPPTGSARSPAVCRRRRSPRPWRGLRSSCQVHRRRSCRSGPAHRPANRPGRDRALG